MKFTDARAIALVVIIVLAGVAIYPFLDKPRKGPDTGHYDEIAYVKDLKTELESGKAGSLDPESPEARAYAMKYATELCSAYTFGNHAERIAALIDGDPIYYHAAGPATYHICSEYWPLYKEVFDR